MDIRDCSAIVTGAGSGLGAATASALAQAGARVFGLDLQVPDDGVPGVEYRAVDVTEEQQVRGVVDEAASLAPLRVTVNCAGIAPTARIVGRSGVHDLDLYRRVVHVNLVGTFTVLALAAEAMARTEPLDHGQRGAVVNTASIAAMEGQVGQAAYASSKGGVLALTITAARDLASLGIRVNTIAPGIVETPMLATVREETREALAGGIPFPQRLARPEEYARLAMMMIEHDYLNGETIRMDGALRMAPR